MLLQVAAAAREALRDNSRRRQRRRCRQADANAGRTQIGSVLIRAGWACEEAGGRQRCGSGGGREEEAGGGGASSRRRRRDGGGSGAILLASAESGGGRARWRQPSGGMAAALPRPARRVLPPPRRGAASLLQGAGQCQARRPPDPRSTAARVNARDRGATARCGGGRGAEPQSAGGSLEEEGRGGGSGSVKTKGLDRVREGTNNRTTIKTVLILLPPVQFLFSYLSLPVIFSLIIASDFSPVQEYVKRITTIISIIAWRA